MENEHFPGIDEIREVQHRKNRTFSSEPGHSNVKEASYRKVGVYIKSMKKYRHERERRRQVRLLAEKGHTQKQIASELGVSTRTIKRDWGKIRSYIKGQTRKEIRPVVDAHQKEFEQRYQGLTANEKLHLLKQDIKSATKSAHKLSSSHTPRNPHQQPLRQVDYILDLDSPTTDGFPSVILPQKVISTRRRIRNEVLRNKKQRKKKNSSKSPYQQKPPHPTNRKYLIYNVLIKKAVKA